MAITKTQQKAINEARKLLERWRKSPLLWVKDNFPTVKLSTQQKEYFVQLGELVNAKVRLANGQTLTPEQEELSRKVGISISAGQGVGKDFVTALTMFWFLWCNPCAEKHPKWNPKDRPKVVATGVNAKHLRNVLWAELSKIINLSKTIDPEGEKPILKELFDWKTERLEYRDNRFENWFAEAITINANASEEEQARTLYGRHAHSMMIVADEAAGIPDPVFVTMEGTMTDPVNFALMIFNPIKTSGYAIRSQNEERHKWVALRWDAEESELVSRESIEHKRKYGEDSYEWRVLVKGLPPLVEQNTLIPPDWVLAAVNRDVGTPQERGTVIGADISGGGDRSVVCVREGDTVRLIESKVSPDTTVTEDWIYGHYIREQAAVVVVDNVGIGAPVYDHLVKRLTARKGDARQTPTKDRFFNRRAEVYWTLREKFETGAISIPNDSELINELCAIQYDPQNKCKIEGKKELRRKLGGASPDKADALALTYYVDDLMFTKAARRGNKIDFTEVYLR